MNEVKRYEMEKEYSLDIVVVPVEQSGGAFVLYEDYDALAQQLKATTNSLTNAQEALKAAGIEADTVQAGVMELVDRLVEADADNRNYSELLSYHIDRQAKAEAKLAELEKQEPAGKFAFEPLAERYHHIKHGEAQNMEPKLPLVKLFTRAAPAIDLNAVRAEGLDMAAAEVDRWVGCDLLAREIRQKSAQLRAGNTGKDGV